MICPNCNKVIKDGAKFCGHCGSDISLAKHSITDDSIDNIIVHGFTLLSSGSFDEAKELFDSATRKDAKNAQAMLGKLLCDLRLHNESNLENCSVDFGENINYRSLLVFADSDLKMRLSAYQRKAAERAMLTEKERKYNDACAALENERFTDAVVLFEELGYWQDSAEKIEICNQGIERLRIEAEKRAEEKRIQDELQAKKIKKYAIIFSAALIVFIAIILIINKLIVPMSQYNKAEKLLKEGNYGEAYIILEDLGEFKNADERILQDKYDRAMKGIEKGNFDYAYSILKQIGSFKNADTFIIENTISRAITYLDDKEYSKAYDLLNSSDSSDAKIVELRKKAFKEMLIIELNLYDSRDELANSINFLNSKTTNEDFDVELQKELTERKNTYRDKIINLAATAFPEKNYKDAISIIEEGLTVLPNDYELLSKKSEYEEYIPVNLYELETEKSFSYELKETANDVHGKTHANAMVVNSYRDITLITDGKYNILEMKIVPKDGFGEKYRAVAKISIYADDELIFESEKITIQTVELKIAKNISGSDRIIICVESIGNENGGFSWATHDLLIYDATVRK